MATNQGLVSVGMDHDTALYCVGGIRAYLKKEFKGPDVSGPSLIV
ncbi:MAG: hypothetical protein JSV09_15170 [Thermoplasmata archaeon]|nr:MAG: hypothetical protein JSV09_15170 [Thermoplasmata archaeon]